MENQSLNEEKLRAEKQDTLSSEKEEYVSDSSNKKVISIKDVIEKHPTSKSTHDLPLDEQQYDEHHNTAKDNE